MAFGIHRCASSEDVADLVADTFLAAFRAADRYRPQTATAAPWLLGIATRLAWNQQRTLARGDEETSVLPGASAFTGEEYEAVEAAIDAALDGAGNLAITVRRTDRQLRDRHFGGCPYSSTRLVTRTGCRLPTAAGGGFSSALTRRQDSPRPCWSTASASTPGHLRASSEPVTGPARPGGQARAAPSAEIMAIGRFILRGGWRRATSPPSLPGWTGRHLVIQHLENGNASTDLPGVDSGVPAWARHLPCLVLPARVWLLMARGDLRSAGTAGGPDLAVVAGHGRPRQVMGTPPIARAATETQPQARFPRIG